MKEYGELEADKLIKFLEDNGINDNTIICKCDTCKEDIVARDFIIVSLMHFENEVKVGKVRTYVKHIINSIDNSLIECDSCCLYMSVPNDFIDKTKKVLEDYRKFLLNEKN